MVATSYENTQNNPLAISIIKTYLYYVKKPNQIKILLTQLMSLYRKVKKPKESIQTYFDNEIFLEIESVALISLSASYLDIKLDRHAEIYIQRTRKKAHSKEDYVHIKAVERRLKKEDTKVDGSTKKIK